MVSLWQRRLFSKELYLETLNSVILLTGVSLISYCRLLGLSLLAKPPQILFFKAVLCMVNPARWHERGERCWEEEPAVCPAQTLVTIRWQSNTFELKTTHFSPCWVLGGKVCWARPGLVTRVIVL